MLATRVQLRWTWAREAGATLLVARQGVPASGPDDPFAITATVSRGDYERSGSWTLSLPWAGNERPGPGERQPSADAESSSDPAPLPSRMWFVRAYSLAEVDGVSQVSPGLEPTASTAVPGPHPEVTVSYVLTRPWLPWRFPTLITHTEPPGTAVPPLVVIANERAVPVSADDGRVIARLPAGHDGSRHVVQAPGSLARSQIRAFIDPSLEPDSLPPIRLRHPETGSTRL
jgi:hypothetical protein